MTSLFKRILAFLALAIVSLFVAGKGMEDLTDGRNDFFALIAYLLGNWTP